MGEELNINDFHEPDTAQTQQFYGHLTCFREIETGVECNKGAGVLEDTEVSAEEDEQLQKKKGEDFFLLNALIKGIIVCSLTF